MSAAVITPRIAEASPRFKGRTAGAFWLMTILAGAFALFFGGRLVVSGDAAATAANILAHEPLFRLGVAADLIATACYSVATLFVYDLFKPVNRNLSLLAAFFSLAGCAIGALSLVFRLVPLLVLGGAQYLRAFTVGQLQALAYTFLRLQGQASSISFVFFGLHCLLVGCLILSSTFLPRIVGALMVCAGLGWLTQGFANLLAPALGHSLLTLWPPASSGEGSLTLSEVPDATRYQEGGHARVKVVITLEDNAKQ